MTSSEKEDFQIYLLTNVKNGMGTANKIIHYVDARNFLQILYSYGFQVLRKVLKYLEQKEDYERCAELRDTVLNYNKSTGTRYRL